VYKPCVSKLHASSEVEELLN